MANPPFRFSGTPLCCCSHLGVLLCGVTCRRCRYFFFPMADRKPHQCCAVHCCVTLRPFFCLPAESVDAHQRSFDLGIQIGYQRRNKDVLAWVKKRRRTIRREDLISFLCGKVPPPRNSRAPPRLTVVSPNRATSTETSSSVETDLQPFREAIALHGNGPFFNTTWFTWGGGS